MCRDKIPGGNIFTSFVSRVVKRKQNGESESPDWKVCRARARNRPRTFWSAPAAHAHFRLVMLARAHMSIMPAQTHAKKF